MATLNLGRVGFVNKGAWSIATAYKINDTVTYGGGVYAALQAHTGQTPVSGGSAYWQEWIPTDSAAYVSGAIHAATSKTTPVDADELGIVDSAALNVLKKLTWANLKATLKAYFDAIYATLASPAFTGTPTAPTAAVGTNTTQIATTAWVQTEKNPIVYSTTIAGAAVTSIDVTGLDINAHGGAYEIELRFINATASAGEIYIYINGDTTNTNYYTQSTGSNNTTLLAARNNFPRFTSFLASSRAQAIGNLNLIASYPMAHIRTNYGAPASVIEQPNSVQKTATVTNITQITLTSSVASAINIGSQLIIRRKDN